MHLVQVNLEYRVIIGISAMLLLFTSFLVVFISSQRKKLQYHKSLHALHEEQQRLLTEQNLLLEKKVEERKLHRRNWFIPRKWHRLENLPLASHTKYKTL
jgi:two-component system, NtrC family, sensor kinase